MNESGPIQIRRLRPLVRMAIPVKVVPPKPTKWRRLRDYPPPSPQPTPCRLWQGAIDKYGYGKKKVRYSRDGPWIAEKVHRWALNMSRERRLRPEQVVLHLCDNPLCYRIDHLKVGTVQDNNADMLAKGRASKPPVNHLHGERHGMSKLNAEKVADIRRWHAEGVPKQQIADRLEISRTTVRRVIEGISWAEAPPGMGTAAYREYMALENKQRREERRGRQEHPDESSGDVRGLRDADGRPGTGHLPDDRGVAERPATDPGAEDPRPAPIHLRRLRRPGQPP
jgi:hypothetical protein